ncbi:G-alpha-domain-containing protein [Roridomyces roridus]|uniref:G-alpha-domain-containing protein n=1 Tax=Roridomyces roridus TaxID=1738132 RepID=A0AAD7C208_9AGAR|nr:G-alpha-domain-containing protein [Roridomyces roridus]
MTMDDPLDAVLRPPPNETAEEAAFRLSREAEARRISASIDADIRAERLLLRKKRIVRLLLLGQSESGKSTTLRQFQRIYTPTAFREERVLWRAVIQLNIVRSVLTILDALDNNDGGYLSDGPTSDLDLADDDSEDYESRFAHTPAPALDTLRRTLLPPLRHIETLLIARLVPKGEKEATRLGAGVDDHEIFVRPGNRWKAGKSKSPVREEADAAQQTLHSFAPAMQALWTDPAVRAVLKRRKIRLEEGPGFFLNDLARVTAVGYLPADDDVLRARLKTVGASEYTFEMEVSTGRETGTEWRIVDVGGSRSQRATWVPFFDDVDAIIFLAPIAGFDQVLSEDKSVNRLEDSVLLWKALCSNKMLASVDLVLFLNKCDILAKKLQSGVKLARYVRSYKERENSFEAVSSYLRTKFSAIHREHSPNPRKFYAFCTSVTDTTTTGGIIASVRDMVVREHLKQSKLL